MKQNTNSISQDIELTTLLYYVDVVKTQNNNQYKLCHAKIVL